MPLSPSRSPRLLHVTAGGLTMAVWDWPGQDPPLVFAHATSFHGRCWDQVIRRCPDRHCLAPEARGHGRSAKPDPPYHWRPFGLDLAEIAEQLGVRAAVGIGHSMGGHAVTTAAALRPATFQALLLVDPTIRVPETYGTEPLDAAFIRRRRARWSSPAEMFESFRLRAPFDRWQSKVLQDYCNFGLLPQDGAFGLACPPDAEASIYECSKEPEANLYPLFSSISIPVTVLRAGFVDRPLFRSEPSATDPLLASRFARGQDVFLPEHAHLIPMEAPELVAEYIDRHDGPGGRP